ASRERYHVTSVQSCRSRRQEAGCCRPASGSKAERLSFPLCFRKRTYLPLLELLPPPALRERRHRRLARRLVPVDRPAVFVVAIGQRPQPWLAYRRGAVAPPYSQNPPGAPPPPRR